MATGVFADFSQIRSAADQLNAGSAQLAGFSAESETSWLGSAAVSTALIDTTSVRHARAQVLSQQLMDKASGLRQAVTDMVAADTAAAQAVIPR